MNIKKISLILASSTLLLSACDDEKTYDYDESTSVKVQASGAAGTTQFSAVFDLGKRELPTVTDFLTAYPTDDNGNAIDPADADGTLKASDGDAEANLTNEDGTLQLDDKYQPIQNPKYNPAYSALDDLDGFSRIAPFYIELTNSIDPTTVSGNVYIQAVNYGDASPKIGEVNRADPFDMRREKDAKFKVEVTSYADAALPNSVLKITPTQPLASDTRYLVILTTGIKNTKGENLLMPFQYDFMYGDKPLPTPAAIPARAAIKNWMLLAQGYFIKVLRQPTSRIAMAYTFVTGARDDVMNAMAAPGNFNSALQDKREASEQYNQAKAKQSDSNYRLSAPAPRVVTFKDVVTGCEGKWDWANARSYTKQACLAKRIINSSEIKAYGLSNSKTTFTTGDMQLPYYIEAPKGAYTNDNIDPQKTGYASCKDDKSNIATCTQAQLTAAKTILGQWRADKDGVYKALGSSNEKDKTPSDNITNFYPFAKAQGKTNVPVLVVLPKNCSKPSSGWPVTIYMHDLKRHRMDAIAYAENQASDCRATVAIDLPLHGPMPSEASGTQLLGNQLPMMAYINWSKTGRKVGGILTALDSNTFVGLYATQKPKAVQLIKDLTLAQRHFGLTKEKAAFRPTAASQEAGESGGLFLNFLHFQSLRDNIRQAVMDLLNLNASIAFMDYDNDGKADFNPQDVSFVGVGMGGIVGTQFVALNNHNLIANNPNGNKALNPIKKAIFIDAAGGLAQVIKNSDLGKEMTAFYTKSKEDGGPGLTENSRLFKTLLYVYQASIDSADPLTYVEMLKSTQTPFLMLNTQDNSVIPNRLEYYGYAGSAPLAKALGVINADSNTSLVNMTPARAHLLFSKSGSNHGLIIPKTNNKGKDAAYSIISDFIKNDNPAKINAGSNAPVVVPAQ